VVEAAIARGGRLAPGHALLLEARRAEGNQALWAAASGQPDHVRTYAARLMAIEDLLATLPASE
jgi:hypothetical protein